MEKSATVILEMISMESHFDRMLLKLFIIVMSICRVTSQNVNLNSKGYTSFPTDDVPADTKRLYIEHNQIITIATGSMSHLTSLEYVNFANNKLEDLGDLSAVASTITEIALNNNPLKVLPAGSFDGFDVLSILHLDNCQLDAMPELSDIGDTLKHLSMQSNSLTGEIPNERMADLQVLEKLYLTSNKLTKMPNLSSAKDTVTDLVIRSNDIEYVSGNMMSSLTTLKNLDIGYLGPCLINISSPNIDKITFQYVTADTSYDFYNLEKVTQITIQNSYSTWDYPSITGDLVLLDTLTLSNLRITEVPSHLVQQTPTVTGLTLTKMNPSNDVKQFQFPGDRRDVVSVTKLYLHDNYLTRIPDLNYMKNSLEYLGINSNKITTVSYSDLGDCTKLTNINFGRNLLSSLPYFDKIHLIGLTLEYNKFTSLPLMVKNLKSGPVNLAHNYEIVNITHKDAHLLSGVTLLSLHTTDLEEITDYIDIDFNAHINIGNTNVDLFSCKNAWLIDRRDRNKLGYNDVACPGGDWNFSNKTHGMDAFLQKCTGSLTGDC